MKKSKKFLVLAASTLGLFSLAGCGSVTPNDNAIVTFKNTSGEITTYTADSLFEKYTQEGSKSTRDFYNAIYDVMVREWFNLEENKALKAECDDEAEVLVDADKSTASTKADDNNTFYDDEWEAVLDSKLSDIAKDKRSEEELRLKYQLEKYKEKLEDEYYDKYKTWKKDNPTSDDRENNLFWGENGYLTTKIPYHVNHILINVDAENNNYYDGQVSSSNVSNLYLTINELAKGTNFGQVAEDFSGDGSASSFGSLDPMVLDTPFVNEFKLGIYAYETYFSTDEEVNKSLDNNKNPFSIPQEDGEYIKSLGIASIPFGAITKMYELKDTVTDQNQKLVNDGDSSYYPRNILFNKYFNNHNLAFITPDDLSGANPTLANEGDILNAHYSDLDEYGRWTNGATNTEYEAMKGFKTVKLKDYDVHGNYIGTVTKKILCDHEGNPIIVVRAGTSSYQGIHFIVIRRSGLAQNKEVTVNGETYNVPLNEYYASENPLTSSGAQNTNFPKTTAGNNKQTYVNAFSTTYDTYNSRLNSIKDNAKTFDANYEMRIFEWLKDVLSAKFNKVNGVDFDAKLAEYIVLTRENTLNDERISNLETWDSFIEQLQVQQSQRKTKLIPETCALHFKEGYKNNSDSVVREACYYEK